MSSLTLAIMAAGMGSRYGGMKQLDRFGESGEILMEYSIYDAIRAGFDRVIVILKEETLDEFKNIAGDRISKHVQLDYVFQRMDFVPDGFEVPQNRVKPWGTAHAAASLDGIVNEPFCIINADDFYGSRSYEIISRFLQDSPYTQPYRCCMAGYAIENTLSENGTVTRGICEVNGPRLVKLTERFKIKRRPEGKIVDEDTRTVIPEMTYVSMNMFGFQKQITTLLKERFEKWLKTSNTEKDEYLLPTEVTNMMNDGILTIDVLPTSSKWYGVTYLEDKEPLVAKLHDMISAGVYPRKLW